MGKEEGIPRRKFRHGARRGNSEKEEEEPKRKRKPNKVERFHRDFLKR